MRYGLCCSATEAARACAWGCDYVEPALTPLVEVNDAALRDMRTALDGAGMRAETFNRFFDASRHRLLGDSAQVDVACEHARKVLAKAAALGGDIAVLGSGPARSRPEGMSEIEALERFSTTVWRLGDIAAAAGMRIVIEPLSPADNNLILTVAQALAFVQQLTHPAVGVLADLYHIGCNGEDYIALAHTSGLLWHAHIAHPTKRHYPTAEDGADYAAFFAALREGGYDGRISIEASGDAAGTPAALELLRGFEGA